MSINIAVPYTARMPNYKVSTPDLDFEGDEVRKLAVTDNERDLVVLDIDETDFDDPANQPNLGDWCIASVDGEVAIDGEIVHREFVSITSGVGPGIEPDAFRLHVE